jgi:hypothetical protein
MDFFIVPVIFGLIVAIAVAASASSRRYETQWKAAAQRLQLGLQAGRWFSRPKISGSVGSLTVIIDVSSSSSGSSSSVRTRYRVGYPSLGLDLRMTRQTGLAKAAALLGMSDVKIGDPAFDEAFAVKTSDPQRLTVRLSPATRRILLDMVEDYRSVKITDEQVSYEKNGIDRDTGVVVTTAQRLIEAARALQGATVESTRPDPAPPVPVREPIPPPPPVLQPDPFDPKPVFDPVPPPPIAPEQPRPPQAQPRPMETKPAPVGSAPPTVTADEVAGVLFARKGLSFQIARLFEEDYEGQAIDWAGEVREVITGIGPNDPTRVTVLVATVRHELFGLVQVEAIASLTGRTPRGLAAGQQINLTGTLSGIDAMSRRLFVDAAHIKEVRSI